MLVGHCLREVFLCARLRYHARFKFFSLGELVATYSSNVRLSIKTIVTAETQRALRFYAPWRRTISLIQLGAKGEVQPLETG